MFQILISNTNSPICYSSLYKKGLNSSIWPIDETLTGQSGPGSNGHEGVLHIPQSSRTGASPSDAV